MIWFCRKGGCWKMCSHGYCEKHQCKTTMCYRRVSYSSKYCFYHKCTLSRCDERKFGGFSYCAKHKCVDQFCDIPAMMNADGEILSTRCSVHNGHLEVSSVYM